ncbi:MAG: hypothetical protein R3190_14630 [Thermoanaerobaculia bacterium]|nr:hypothetical protein [Thermoanaerobaculia bacterium]
MQSPRTPSITGYRLAAAASVLALATVAPTLAGDIEGDARIGVYTDVSEAFVGGGIATPLGDSGWDFNPNLELVFVDRGDLATLNFDFTYDLIDEAELDFWLGAGAALVLRENRRGDDETDAGLNLLAGAGFLPEQSVRPFVQGKVLISDDTEFVLAFGIRFF